MTNTSRPNGVFIVDSKLNQSNGQPIKLEWRSVTGPFAARITDVKVEGVSMVMTDVPTPPYIQRTTAARSSR